MSLAPGARLGAYEVVAFIGAGGMGEVYRARDTRLARDVAIKILPESFASDPDRVARFQREAHVLASLNHPNIAQIHGLEESPPHRALILELVEGPTLADRIAQGPVPLDEAVLIARQIAEALQAAHEHGVVHRDLKPANIKLTNDGCVKVLDFGLAKPLAVDGEGMPSGSASLSPTLTTPAMTGMGVILGTAAYMSPEQAKGKPVDKRADIWGFGCVIFETLTGKRAFDGEDATETLAFIIARDPDWAALPKDLHPAVQRLVKGCLERDRRRRISDIAVAIFALDEASSGPAATHVGSPRNSRKSPQVWRRLAPVAAAAIVAAMFAGPAGWLARRPNQPRVARTVISAPTFTLGSAPSGRELAITPDGTRVIYVGDGATQLYVRSLDQLEPALLGPAGQRLTDPFVSPDGQWVGYFDGGTLKKVALAGGPAKTLAETGIGRGATWAADGTIVFSAFGGHAGLHRITAAGGEPSVLTTAVLPHERDHWWPEFLPGGHAVLFTIATSDGPDASEIAVLDLRSGHSKVLIRGGTHAHYLTSGHLVFGESGTLRAVPFDVERLEIIGAPKPIISGVVTEITGAVQFGAGHDTLVYAIGTPGSGSAAFHGELVSITRDGRATPLNLPIADYGEPRLSPDRQRLAVTDGRNIWAYDLTRGTRVRLTADGGAVRPAWTPDGARLTFRSIRESDLFSTLADGSAKPEPLLVRPGPQFSGVWSPDGAVLAFDEFDRFGGRDIGLLPKGGTPILFLATRFDERNLRFSPDGRWVAYVSDESGRDEVYLQPYPGPGPKVAISASGGREPVWSPRGGELFYRQDRHVMAVSIRTNPSLVAGTPKTLFEGDYATDRNTPNYEVFPDGERFIMIRVAPQTIGAAPTIILVQNWFEELKRLVPPN